MTYKENYDIANAAHPIRWDLVALFYIVIPAYCYGVWWTMYKVGSFILSLF